MPLALVWAPLIAVAIVAWHRFLAIPAALVWLFTPAYLLHNADRQLVGAAPVFKHPKTQIMFPRSTILPPVLYRDRHDHQRSTRVLWAWSRNADDWEYPLWRMTGGALHGIKFVDINPSDLKGKPVPSYDMAVCTDLRPNACAILAKPGWTVTVMAGIVQVATRNH